MGRNFRGARAARQRKSEPFLAKGIQVLGLTAALWLVSLFLKGSPALTAVSSGLRSILWLPLTIGLALLAAHFALKKLLAAKGAQAADDLAPAQPTREPSAPPVAPPSLIRAQPIDPEPAGGRQTHWSPEVFATIEWRRFEALVEALFAQGGFETRSQTHGADGGVDIWLYSRHAQGPVSVVQCKHWHDKSVGVKEMREFLGVMVSKGVKRGAYATTSRFTTDALEFAKANGINAQDGDALLALIARRTPEQQTQLLALAHEGEYWKPTCASCGVKMSERMSHKDGSRFWACSDFPRCRRTMPMRGA